MSSLVVRRVCGKEKKAEEWKKLEHVVFISSPMSGKPVKVMMLLCPAQCDFEELFLSLQRWVIKMGEGGIPPPPSHFCTLCSMLFFPPDLSCRAVIWGLCGLYLTFFPGPHNCTLGQDFVLQSPRWECEASGQTKIKVVLALLSNLFFRLRASVNPPGKVMDSAFQWMSNNRLKYSCSNGR